MSFEVEQGEEIGPAALIPAETVGKADAEAQGGGESEAENPFPR